MIRRSDVYGLTLLHSSAGVLTEFLNEEHCVLLALCVSTFYTYMTYAS